MSKTKFRPNIPARARAIGRDDDAESPVKTDLESPYPADFAEAEKPAETLTEREIIAKLKKKIVDGDKPVETPAEREAMAKIRKRIAEG